ncbi:MAG: AAA family ATPase [Ruminococcus sp.]|nr:AAA family ATPase [Ruminococcus sp.]
MSKVIVLASGKGGTGKSTVSVGLAVAMAKQLKRKVLLVDCDSGMRGVDLMLGIEKDVVYDVSDAVGGNCDKSAAIYVSPHVYNLHIMPAALSADDEISPSVLKELIEELKDDYDYVLIDSPAGTGSGFEAAAAAADTALIVINPEPISVRGGQNIRRKLAELGIENVRLVINRFSPERFARAGIFFDLDAVIDAMQTQLIAIVPEDIMIANITQRGNYGAACFPASAPFRNIVLRLEGKNPPLARFVLEI